MPRMAAIVIDATTLLQLLSLCGRPPSQSPGLDASTDRDSSIRSSRVSDLSMSSASCNNDTDQSSDYYLISSLHLSSTRDPETPDLDLLRFDADSSVHGDPTNLHDFRVKRCCKWVEAIVAMSQLSEQDHENSSCGGSECSLCDSIEVNDCIMVEIATESNAFIRENNTRRPSALNLKDKCELIEELDADFGSPMSLDFVVDLDASRGANTQQYSDPAATSVTVHRYSSPKPRHHPYKRDQREKQWNE
ncbi:hypothetical protein FS749_002118 [Ceratobasidium sp. UAMH 11750]|nr:hypothetical protein FS749_002118 [Ceratobasidium sp. UAMH 11750]